MLQLIRFRQPFTRNFMSRNLHIAVYGNGQLGQQVCHGFSSETVTSIDGKINSNAKNNITVDFSSSPEDQSKTVLESCERLVKQDGQFDGVIVTAGGWVGGNAKSDLMTSTIQMFNQCIVSSVIASRIASKHLKEGGLLVLTGSAAALDPTPGMLAYGFSKSAVHHLCKSLAAKDSGINNATVCALLPETLDTPSNRAGMPKSDCSSWTPMEHLVNQLKYYIYTQKPPNGSLIKISTFNNQTQFHIV